jgi:hypothetical protein
VQSFRRDGAYWLRKAKAKSCGLVPAARGRSGRAGRLAVLRTCAARAVAKNPQR